MSERPADGRWTTAISHATEDEVRIRGYDLASMIGRVDFGSMVHLLLVGEMPDAGRARVVNAVLTSMADHSVAPSSIVSRYLASAGVPLQVAIAGGVMSFGDVYGGACEQAARVLQDGVRAGGEDLAGQAEEIVDSARSAGVPVPGFGHPLHPRGDPRVPALVDVARVEGLAGPHIALAEQIGEVLGRRRRRPVPFNNDGAIAAVAGDLGLGWRAVRALVVISRSVGLAAHSLEEQEREPGWRHVPLSEITYDGPAPRDLD